METINIFGENRFETYTKTRKACRGIVISNGMILLTYEVNTDQWFIPGGGLESGESLEACCVRELAEETGCIVRPIHQYLTINEYYEEWLFESHYFICEIEGETARKLTEREAEGGLEPRWIPVYDAVDIFSKHNTYAATDEMKRGAYLREYEALSYLWAIPFGEEEIQVMRKQAAQVLQWYDGMKNVVPTWYQKN